MEREFPVIDEQGRRIGWHMRQHPEAPYIGDNLPVSLMNLVLLFQVAAEILRAEER
jgi:hypothetical protein